MLSDTAPKGVLPQEAVGMHVAMSSWSLPTCPMRLDVPNRLLDRPDAAERLRRASSANHAKELLAYDFAILPTW